MINQRSCDWCHKPTPTSELTPVAKTIDPEIGMADKEEFVCNICLEPHWRAQRETDANAPFDDSFE